MFVKLTNNGQSFLCSPRQAAALELLMDSNAGGFASVKGYVSKSTGEVFDSTFISRFSISRMYERTIEALEGFTAADVIDRIRDNPKIKALSTQDFYDAFDARKAAEIASMQKTLDGVRDDARRQSHDRNYHTLTNGVKVHFVTETVDQVKTPILKNFDGETLPVVESIMLNIIQVSKTTIVEGEYKTVNSGVPVIIGNALKAILPKSCKMKNLSLKEDNFESIKLAGLEYIPEDFKGLYTAN
ncbi:MAG: hypothetical protein PF495_13435 [Spirochaetales bacterium]|jgi:hypothetical protein|nr:hypothetical protein [Spirochaetales bacterium]